MLVSAIFRHAAAAPDREALTFNGEPWSYGRFAAEIRGQADAFAARGLAGPGLAVVTHVDLRRAWTASLALRALGLTSLPARSLDDLPEPARPAIRCVAVDPAAPPDRAVLEPLAGAGAAVIEDAPARGEPSNAPGLDGGHALRTSGTTGPPKLVAFTAAGEAGLFALRRSAMELDARTRVHLLDLGLWTGVGYGTAAAVWAAGGAVVLRQGGRRIGAFSDGPLTHMVATPALLEIMLLELGSGSVFRPDLRLSLTGGAPRREAVRLALGRITPRVFNRVASTEAGIFFSTRLRGDADLTWHDLAPGREARILDAAGAEAPAGAEGLLAVRLPGAPEGYLLHPEETARRFRDGWFVTGDTAVAGADGRMSIRGRSVDAVHILGAKLNPEPLEAAVCDRIGARGACLFSSPAADGEEAVFLVLEGAEGRDPADIARALGDLLPGVRRVELRGMTPLPRNAMGKLLRGQVRAAVLDPALWAPQVQVRTT